MHTSYARRLSRTSWFLRVNRGGKFLKKLGYCGGEYNRIIRSDEGLSLETSAFECFASSLSIVKRIPEARDYLLVHSSVILYVHCHDFKSPCFWDVNHGNSHILLIAFVDQFQSRQIAQSLSGRILCARIIVSREDCSNIVWNRWKRVRGKI